MRAPITDAPADGCGVAGPKSGAQPSVAIFAASPSNSPRRMSSRFFRSGLLAAKALRAALHAGLALLFLALSIPTWRRLSRAYAVYIVAVLGVPLLSSTEFIGLGRYAMAAFPCFVVLALLFREHPRARLLWLCASAILLMITTSKFAIGRYIS